MSTIATRSAIIHWHGPDGVPPDLAYVVSDYRGHRRVVTWAEVLEERRSRQRRILENLREVTRWRACRLSVAYFDQSLMGGWHAFLDGLERWSHVWIDRDARDLQPQLLALYPLLLPLGTPYDQWEAWKPVFAKHFARRRQDDRPVGVAMLWRRRSELARAVGGRR